MKKVLIAIAVIAVITVTGVVAYFGLMPPSSEDMGITDTSITIEHTLGSTVIKENPSSVIVFDYGVLDNLDKMGVNIIGVPKDATFPAHLSKFEDDKYKNVGSLKEPDLETIYELSPELIIISGRMADFYDELSKIAPTLYMAVDNTNYYESLIVNIQSLETIFNMPGAMSDYLSNISMKIDEVNTLASENGYNALVILSNNSDLSAYGINSRFGIIHRELGLAESAMGLEDTTHGQSISNEFILEMNPDFLFVVDRTAVVGGDANAQATLNNSMIQSTNAYKNDKIIYLSADVWYTAVGGAESTMIMIDEVLAALSK